MVRQAWRGLLPCNVCPRLAVQAVYCDVQRIEATFVFPQVAGVIETTRPDAKNAQYQSAIKHGDMLLNRLQKLSKVIDDTF